MVISFRRTVWQLERTGQRRTGDREAADCKEPLERCYAACARHAKDTARPNRADS
jgi:hypothetical protein